MNRKKGNQKTIKRSVVRLSVKKTKRIEKGFTATIKGSRSNYLAKELEKYKNIKVVYD